MIPRLLSLLLSLSLADHRLSKQRQAWVRIVNLIEPEGLFTDIPLRSVVLHNPRHQDKIEHDFVYNIASIPYYSISSEWLAVNATNAVESGIGELSPTGTAYILTLSDDPYTPLNPHWYPFLDVLFVEEEEQVLLTLDRKRVDRHFTGSVCNLGVAPASSSSSSTLSLCLHNNHLLKLNTTRIVLHLTQADCQGECSPNVTASVSTVGDRMRFPVGNGRQYVSVKYLGITAGYTTQTELCRFYITGSGHYSSLLRVNSTVSTMYECVTFQLQQPKHHFPIGVMVAVGVVTTVVVVVLCLYALYRCCPAARVRQMFQPARKRLSLQDIHVMHGTSSGAVTKEPQYDHPAELQYYEMPTADPYADIGPVPESVYESVYESIDDQSNNTYSLPSHQMSHISHQMSHISLDSRPSPGRHYNPRIAGSQYNVSSNKDSVKGSR